MNPLDFFFQFTAVFVLGIIALTLGRALAARIAGPHAPLVLGGPIITINITLPHRREMEEDQEVDVETGNTETPGNTENTAISTVSDYMTVTDSAGSRLVKRMTQEELIEFTKARNDALDLLKMCLEYDHKLSLPDDGTIPHYTAFTKRAKMEVGIGAKTRGDIVANLEYSGLVSVKDRKSTRVVPVKDPDSEHPLIIGSCTELIKLITRGRVWVYPDGYNERKYEQHMDAVMALPGCERE